MSHLFFFCCFGTASNSPSVRQVVDSRQSPGQMVWLLIRRSNSHTESNILRCGGHSRYDSERLIHRPLRARDNRRIEIARSLVHIISAYTIRSVLVCDERVGILPRTSAMNIPWNFASSSSFASSIQWRTSLKRQDSSLGCRHRPGD